MGYFTRAPPAPPPPPPPPLGISVEEFWAKYASGRSGKFLVPVAIPKLPGDEDAPTMYDMAEREVEICEAALGNFLVDFLNHTAIPENRRRDDWKQVYALYKSTLNRVGKWQFPRLG